MDRQLPGMVVSAIARYIYTSAWCLYTSDWCVYTSEWCVYTSERCVYTSGVVCIHMRSGVYTHEEWWVHPLSMRRGARRVARAPAAPSHQTKLGSTARLARAFVVFWVEASLLAHPIAGPWTPVGLERAHTSRDPLGSLPLEAVQQRRGLHNVWPACKTAGGLVRAHFPHVLLYGLFEPTIDVSHVLRQRF